MNSFTFSALIWVQLAEYYRKNKIRTAITCTWKSDFQRYIFGCGSKSNMNRKISMLSFISIILFTDESEKRLRCNHLLREVTSCDCCLSHKGKMWLMPNMQRCALVWISCRECDPPCWNRNLMVKLSGWGFSCDLCPPVFSPSLNFISLVARRSLSSENPVTWAHALPNTFYWLLGTKPGSRE